MEPDGRQSSSILFGLHITDEARRDAVHEAMVGHVVGDDRPGSHHRGLTDGQATEDHRPRADRRASLDEGRYYAPIVFCLPTSIGRRPRITIVDEHDAV